MLEFRGSIEFHENIPDIMNNKEFVLNVKEKTAELTINHTEILRGKLVELSKPILSC